MDDLKVFGKNEKEVNSLVRTVEVFSCDICMEFGINKCGVTVIKKDRVSKTEVLRLLNGEIITEVNEGYKYLGILELDEIKEQEMKEVFRKEYMRRLKLIMKSKLHGRNKIKAINTWAVSLMRYGAGVIGWTKQELQKMDRKTRKVMTMIKELYLKSDTARLYVPRKRGGIGLIICEDHVRTEGNSICWYVKNNKEEMLRKVDEKQIMQNDRTEEPKRYKNNRKQILKTTGEVKKCMGNM